MTFFETIKIDKGRAFHLDYHEQRIAKALSSVGFNPYFSLQQIIQPPSNKLLRCKIIYDNSRYNIEYFEYQQRTVVKLKLLTCNAISYKHKYTNRESIDKLFTCKEEADDILIVKNGYVTDTSIANIAFFSNGVWITPNSPLLEGTTRARLIDEKFLHVRDISVKDVISAQGFALLNAMIGFHQVPNGIITD